LALLHDHFIQQGALVGVATRLAGAEMPVVITAFALAGTLNVIPDISGLVAGFSNPHHPLVTWEKMLGVSYPMRWDVHARYHEDRPWGWQLWRLHTWVDEPFHAFQKPWFSQFWKTEVLFQLLNAAGLALCFM
jgi:hypothetical protein